MLWFWSVTHTDSPRFPGLPTAPDGPLGPGAPTGPADPGLPGSPRSPWELKSVTFCHLYITQSVLVIKL